MFRCEKLDVWQVATAIADDVYRVTRTFPTDQRYGLSSQMQRAAVSVGANIAEGSGRSTSKVRIRFVEIAYGSLMELVSHLEIARRQGFLKQAAFDDLYERCDRLSRMLSGFRDSIKD